MAWRASCLSLLAGWREGASPPGSRTPTVAFWLEFAAMHTQIPTSPGSGDETEAMPDATAMLAILPGSWRVRDGGVSLRCPIPPDNSRK
jgi:hypothetical protein